MNAYRVTRYAAGRLHGFADVLGQRHFAKSVLSTSRSRSHLATSSNNGIPQELSASPPDRSSIKGMSTVEWRDGGLYVNRGHNKQQFLPKLWLRDHCRCARCVNQDTLQKAFNTFSLAEADLAPEKVQCDSDGIKIIWDPHGHTGTYEWDWIARQSDPAGKTDESSRQRLWDARIAFDPPSVHYDEIMAGDQGVAAWTSRINDYGFCFVDDCPVTPEKTQALLERIAFIRTTHYGGFYDFTSDLTMKDTAYTSLALSAHTDTTYFTDPAGLQMFHLLSHTDGGGGASLLVDGFHCARELRQQDARAFDVLCEVPIQWHASGNAGISISPAHRFPVFNLNPDNANVSKRSILQVRWNNDDRGSLPLHLHSTVSVDEWYEAAKLWHEIVRSSRNEYWEQLRPGRPLIFDNWRVLHGRSAFTGKRRMCGGYINHDDFLSRYRNTNLSREEVLAHVL